MRAGPVRCAFATTLWRKEKPAISDMATSEVARVEAFAALRCNVAKSQDGDGPQPITLRGGPFLLEEAPRAVESWGEAPRRRAIPMNSKMIITYMITYHHLGVSPPGENFSPGLIRDTIRPASADRSEGGRGWGFGGWGSWGTPYTSHGRTVRARAVRALRARPMSAPCTPDDTIS